MKLVIKIVLLAAIVVLGYLIWQSVKKPMDFDKEKEKRYDATIQRLKDIRTAQVAFQSEYGHYTSDFDSLIDYVKNGVIKVVKKNGTIPEGMPELEALEKGHITRDTITVNTLDSLYNPGYHIDSLPYVPYTNGEKFIMDAKILEVGSKVNDQVLKVPVFEAKVLNRVLLKGINEQERINLDDGLFKMDKYPGLKVGSLESNVNNAGNWEK